MLMISTESQHKCHNDQCQQICLICDTHRKLSHSKMKRTLLQNDIVQKSIFSQTKNQKDFSHFAVQAHKWTVTL